MNAIQRLRMLKSMAPRFDAAMKVRALDNVYSLYKQHVEMKREFTIS